jgi:hypothetical protein
MEIPPPMNELPTKPPPKFGLMNGLLLGLVIVTLLVAAAFAAYRFLKRENTDNQAPATSTISTNR